MPLTRYLLKNEYGLADPEVYRSADKDDPEALLEGVAMAGLVGLLRQLGDLSEFAAEIFHELHEEVMATAARGHSLTLRIRQLEAEFPPIERALLLQTNHSLYYSNAGVEWHPHLQMEESLIAQGDLPHFIMDSYEESRGPPRLFLLDKFDVAGAGACLKRYTDPSFFKVERLPDHLPSVEVQREKKVRRSKKKGACWRNGETPESVPASHAKLHQLIMEERIENAYNNPAQCVKLKKRPMNGSPFDSKTGKSYMEKFVESSSPVSKIIHEVSVVPSSLKWTQDDTSESGIVVVGVSTTSPVKDVLQTDDGDILSHHARGKQFMDDLEDFEPTIYGETDEVSSTCHADVDKKELMVNGDGNREGSMDGYQSDEMTSEVENYMDALATAESEMDTDTDSRCIDSMTLVKCEIHSGANEDMELQMETLISQSVGSFASNDGNSSFRRSSSLLSSDGVSKMGDSTQFGSDSFSDVLPLPESTVTDSGNLLDDQLPHNKEAFSMGSKDHMLSTGKGIEDDEICDFREVSQTLSSADLESTCIPLNAGSRSCMGSEQDETSSDYMKHATGSSGSDETRENLVDPPALATDNATNQSEGDNLARVSTGRISVDELEDGHLNVCAMTMEHSSDNLELISGRGSRNEVPNTRDVAESCNRILLRMDSPQSRLPLEEQHQLSPHLGVDESANNTFSSASLLPDSDSVQAADGGDEVDDAIPAPMHDLEMSTVSVEEQQVHVKDQILLDEAVKEGKLSDLDLQHKRGEREISQKLVGENTDGLTQNKEAGGGELGDPFDPDIPFAVSVVGTISDDLMLTRVNLEDTNAITNEPQVLVEEQKSLGEAEKVTSPEEDLQEVDNEKEEGSCKEVTHDREDADSLTCNFKAVDGVTVPAAPSGGDDSVLDDLVTLEVQAGAIGNSEASVADIGLVPQDEVDLYQAESPNWVKEAGAKEKVNEVEVGQDLDSVSAVDWNSMAHGSDSTAVGVSGSSLSKQTESGFFYDIETTTTCSEQVNANHALSRMENVISSQNGLLAGPAAASDELSKSLVDEAAVGLHHVDDDIFRSWNLQAKEFQPMDILDQEIFLLPRSEAALDYGSGMQDEVNGTKFQEMTGASHLIGCKDGEMQSVNSLNQEKHEGYSVNLLEEFSIQQPSLSESLQGSTSNTGLHNFTLLSEVGQVNMSEMPPMPPLPPVQWRMGRTPNIPSTQEKKYHGNGQGLFPPLQSSLAKENLEIGFPALEAGTPLTQSPFLSPTCPETENPAQTCPCALQMQSVNSDSVVHSNDMNVKLLQGLVWPEPTFHRLPEQFSLTSDAKLMHDPHLPQSVGGDTNSGQHPESPAGELAHPVDQLLQKTHTEVKDSQHNTQNADEKDCSDLTKTRQEQEDPLNSQEETVGSTYPWALPQSNEGGKPSGILIGNIPRPPKPLIDAVAAHDRSKLKKVAERLRPQLAPKQEERDSLLEQIRTKSFNLKPASVARPSIQQGPKTNLKVAAILDKANAIRQAFAGSDEDDDTDSWSE